MSCNTIANWSKRKEKINVKITMAFHWGLLVIMGSHVLGAEDVWLNE